MSEKHSSKKRGDFYLIFDIRSSSIGAAIIEKHKDTIPTVLFTHRSSITFGQIQDGQSFVSSMSSLLGEVCHKVMDQGILALKKDAPHAKIHSGVIFYASPWYHSYIKNISLKKDKPFILKEEQFNDLIRKEIQQEIHDEDVRVIEKDITHVITNGYEVSDPFDKKIAEISIALYISEMASGALQQIEATIAETFPAVKLQHRTHPLALFTTLRNVFAHTPTFMFMDIGGEITDIGIVENNILTHSITIPLGRNHVIREVAQTTKIDIKSLPAMLEMIYSDTIHDSQSQKIITAIETTKKTWIETIKKTIESVITEIPRNIFLNSEKDVRMMFKQFMLDETLYMKEENTTAFTNIITLDATTFNHLVTYAADCRKDSFIEIETVFLHNNKIHI